MLRAVVLTLHHDSGQLMRDPHRAVGAIDVLPAGAGGAVGVDPYILILDIDFDRVIDHRIDVDRGEAGMPPGVRIKWRNSYQAMYATFGLEPTICLGAGNLDRRRFDPILSS